MKAFNPQLNMFEHRHPPLEQDQQGRTRADIIKLCKSLNEEVIRSITLKEDKKWYIEGMLADKWIELNEVLHHVDRHTDY